MLLLELPLDVWYHYARVVPADALVELARTPLCKRWLSMWMSERALPMWRARWSRTMASGLPSFTTTHPLLGLRSLLDYAHKWVLLNAYVVRGIRHRGRWFLQSTPRRYPCLFTLRLSVPYATLA